MKLGLRASLSPHEEVSLRGVAPADRGRKCPKYPSPPRSGNAFAAAVFAAIPGLLLLFILLWVYAQ
jgi:hypothetical protein